MKATELKGLAAINLDNAEKTGTIYDLSLDLTAGRIIGFVLKGLKDDHSLTRINVQQVQKLGQDALTYRGQGQVLPQGHSSDSPEAEPLSPNQVELSNFVHHQKLVTESGKLLGLVKDVTFEPEHFTITSYDVTEGGLFAKTHSIPADPSIKFGPEIAIVPEQLPVTDRPQA